MHKCVNNTVGNVYHLEQMVDNFFPYSQKQLGFNKPATVVFQSDGDNAARMLGKTAYYNPESHEVVLYTDNRHPKDIMRSLSHELVHHAQNCRGDFNSASPTYDGYAQKDPHLRKMEREAYTKGNLIFRDFEDLIKTGKINIEIDFSESGEPKMSLKEWKNNEINQKLMKKWGLLKEEKNEPRNVKHADDELAGEEAGEEAAEDLEEGAMYRDEDDEVDEAKRHVVGGDPGLADFIMPNKPKGKAPGPGKRVWDPRHLKDKTTKVPPVSAKDIEEGAFGFKSADEKRKELATRPEFTAGGPKEDDPGVDPPLAHALEKDRTAKLPPTKARRRPRVRASDVGRGTQGSWKPVVEEHSTPRKISVREAKEITRRIIERVKKESN